MSNIALRVFSSSATTVGVSAPNEIAAKAPSTSAAHQRDKVPFQDPHSDKRLMGDYDGAPGQEPRLIFDP